MCRPHGPRPRPRRTPSKCGSVGRHRGVHSAQAPCLSLARAWRARMVTHGPNPISARQQSRAARAARWSPCCSCSLTSAAARGTYRRRALSYQRHVSDGRTLPGQCPADNPRAKLPGPRPLLFIDVSPEPSLAGQPARVEGRQQRTPAHGTPALPARMRSGPATAPPGPRPDGGSGPGKLRRPPSSGAHTGGRAHGQRAGGLPSLLLAAVRRCTRRRERLELAGDNFWVDFITPPVLDHGASGSTPHLALADAPPHACSYTGAPSLASLLPFPLAPPLSLPLSYPTLPRPASRTSASAFGPPYDPHSATIPPPSAPCCSGEARRRT